MSKYPKYSPGSKDALRRQAEEKVRCRQPELEDLSGLSMDEIRGLMHELQVHQIELEMQNDELRRSQEELETVRNRYVDLYDFAPVGFLTIGEKGLIQEINLTSAGLLGMDRSALLNKPISRFIVEEDQDIYYRLTRKLLETRKRQTCELKMKKGSSDEFFARMEFTIEESEDADGIRSRVSLSDITEHKRMDEEIRRIQNLESLGLLAGGIAHDFNNVLTGVIGNLSLLEILLDEGSEPCQIASDALTAANKTKALTQQLITFARGGAPIKET